MRAILLPATACAPISLRTRVSISPPAQQCLPCDGAFWPACGHHFLGRKLLLAGNPRLAELDVGDCFWTHLIRIAFKYCEIRFLTLFQGAKAVALTDLMCRVDGHGAD